MEKQQTCAERVAESLASTVDDIQAALDNPEERETGHNPDVSSLWEYGLEFSWEPQYGRQAGYYRWLVSYGGPSSEIRFYPTSNVHKPIVEYWFKDWFDGASVDPEGDALETILTAWEWFAECVSDGPLRCE